MNRFQYDVALGITFVIIAAYIAHMALKRLDAKYTGKAVYLFPLTFFITLYGLELMIELAGDLL